MMVNNNLSMNHHQQIASTTVMMKNGSVGGGATSGNNNTRTVNHNNGPQQHQEDQILEVNLIGTNSNGAPDNVLGDFSEFLDTGQLSDIVMRCSDGRFVECHRLVLAARANNLRHFLCGRNYLVSELVFRNCVKFEHLQALVNLIYRGHINGADHQITSTLWKLFKIFGVRVTAQCFTSGQNGHKELAHQLKYESVETNVAKGALKFEKILREFRSETRKKVRRQPTSRSGVAGEEGAPLPVSSRKKKSGSGQPGVIVISDDEQAEWSSASCSSSVSSLTSSSSDHSVRNGFDGQDGEAEMNPPRAVAPKQRAPAVTQQKPQNGNHKVAIGPSTTAGKNHSNNSNSALKAPRNGQTHIVADPPPQLKIQEVNTDQPPADNWDSSGSSEGEYVETDYKPAVVRPKAPAVVVPPTITLTAMPACLKYNQNEMSIIVKSVPENQDYPGQQRPVEIAPKKQLPMNPVKDTESEAIICSPQILFNIKSEPIDDDEDEEEGMFHMGQLEVSADDLGIKMEIVEEEENYEHISQDRQGRRLPPPLLIPLQAANRQQKQERSLANEDDDDNEEKHFVHSSQLEKLVREMKPHSKRPANFPPFILRNPRGNQTRTYTTDNLWSALMDVKAGESIYRASQQHKVPRKTLRNWMKRCHIKSAYPMPSQLKEAAEKKKLQKYYYQ